MLYILVYLRVVKAMFVFIMKLKIDHWKIRNYVSL